MARKVKGVTDEKDKKNRIHVQGKEMEAKIR